MHCCLHLHPSFIFQQMCEHLDLGGHRGHVALCVISLKSPVLLCGLAMGETELGWPVAGEELCWQSEAREVFGCGLPSCLLGSYTGAG